MTAVLFFLKRVGFFIIDNWRVVLIGLAILVVIIASGLTYRWCGNRKAKLNEQQIQKAQDAIKTRNDEKLKQILAEADTAEENIDAGIKQAEINTANAKKKYDHLSSDELAQELENRK